MDEQLNGAQTPLDLAYAAVDASPEDEGARLRFYEQLADGEMFILLEREVEGETLEPRIFDLESGPVVLVFDLEERLAGFTGGVAPYAALPGRVIAGLLKGQGIGLGVNLGGSPSGMLLPPEAMDWLAETLSGGPEELEAMPEEFLPPTAPPALMQALEQKLSCAGGLAVAALLAGVRYSDGRRGHLLAYLGASPAAEDALARAAREALVFSGIEIGEMDVVFLGAEAAAFPALLRVAHRFDLPMPEARAEAPPPAPPGSDPSKPPRLR